MDIKTTDKQINVYVTEDEIRLLFTNIIYYKSFIDYLTDLRIKSDLKHVHLIVKKRKEQ